MGDVLLGDVPGNAILLNGVLQTANREIGVPGFDLYGSRQVWLAFFRRSC